MDELHLRAWWTFVLLLAISYFPLKKQRSAAAILMVAAWNISGWNERNWGVFDRKLLQQVQVFELIKAMFGYLSNQVCTKRRTSAWSTK